MASKIRRLAILFSLAAAFTLPAVAAGSGDATISGHINDSLGKPQLGVLVEIFTSALAQPVKAYTDAKGFYTANGLLPGIYLIKATANSFLPSLRENVDLHSGSQVMVNLTLNTLVEAFKLVPAVRHTDKKDDDWGWTLRSAANRPILRALENDGPLVMVSNSDKADDRVLKARVAFIAGSDGEAFNSSDVNTAFKVEQSLFNSGASSGTLSFNGNVASGSGQPNGIVRAAYKQETIGGFHPEVALTARRYATAATAAHHAALNAVALSVSDGFSMGNRLELNYGGELQTVQFRGRVTAFRPYGSVKAHLTPDTLVEYRFASSEPSTREEKGFDTSPADLSETNPRVSLKDSAPQLERARHQEISIAQRVGKSNFQAAYYSDVVRRIALTGVGDLESDIEVANLLPDVYASTFNMTGGTLATQGLRLVAQRQLSNALTATLDYGFGGAMAVDQANSAIDSATFSQDYHHSVAAKFSGEIPGSRTRWITSYKWTSGTAVLTPVDMFNASPGQSDPYLNVFIRQPIPGTSFLPGKVEALVDVRNLLSQGYVPMVAQDGRTLYLVQSARAIRGGLAFNF
ncbi:MAG: hypothetical protein JWN45_2211 [Acidobacteriaceae bacterium]|nr:hypothetical protein [Acidobacteriaceae bacterium]